MEQKSERERFVEIDTKRRSFRFFGRGEWWIKSKMDTHWYPLDGTLVPADVLHAVANSLAATIKADANKL
jgi:hypothetical protein